jgi:hypothetical protein
MWVWTRGGTVGCIVGFLRKGTDYTDLVAEYTQRLGPSLREDTANPVARWTVWADDKTGWSIVGPKPGTHSVVALIVSQRDPNQDPADPSYFAPCTRGRRAR